MREKAKIVRIDEPDFGCEGRPDGIPMTDKVTVVLEETGEIRILEEEDEKLWKEKIDEGSLVWITEEGKLEKYL